MDDYQGILQSRTVWSGVIGLTGGLLNLFGYEISAADQLALVDNIANVMVITGTLGAIIFRIHATKIIVPGK